MIKKPITIKEIAKKLDLSISTVSRALHGHPSISLSTQQKVKQMAKEMEYEPNQTAIFFQKGKTFTIGVILPELAEAFFASAISAIEDIAYKKNYTVLLAQSHDDEEREKQLVDKMKNHRIDGLLVSVAKTTANFDHFELLRKHQIPVVFFDRIPPIKNIHYVACNIETGSIEAVNFLLKRGHRSIGLINGPNTLVASGQRKEGYIKALYKNRLKFDPTLIVDCDLTEAGTKAALETLLNHKRKPTAIVTFNDYVSAFAIKSLRRLNLNLDQEIEFVSYANSSIIGFMEHPPVASVEQFPAIQGQKAIDTLLDLLNSDENEETQGYYKTIIESQLVESHKD
ncbi:substrate-binding domain-containing protein [Pedobacter sp. LMG 31464]|uniref:Substrate-binding domain-containing protein n=1 Tax=Pedobacter planticolens TaxID=2679964 RepID=A0A923DZM0_9SPHI|nr:LacI family DNA-binding transcriptional regulator [Pedobacter planticolens]MBB2146020.1 substrate-binding domain-containing protein [Pedobacter planticolens]